MRDRLGLLTVDASPYVTAVTGQTGCTVPDFRVLTVVASCVIALDRLARVQVSALAPAPQQ